VLSCSTSASLAVKKLLEKLLCCNDAPLDHTSSNDAKGCCSSSPHSLHRKIACRHCIALLAHLDTLHTEYRGDWCKPEPQDQAKDQPSPQNPQTPGAYALPKLRPVIQRLMFAKSCKRDATLRSQSKAHVCSMSVLTVLWTWHRSNNIRVTAAATKRGCLLSCTQAASRQGSTATLSAAHNTAQTKQLCHPFLTGRQWREKTAPLPHNNPPSKNPCLRWYVHAAADKTPCSSRCSEYIYSSKKNICTHSQADPSTPLIKNHSSRKNI
jgi:hypothetical protein